QRVAPSSGWAREAPRIDGDRVYFAPFDSDELHAGWLRGRRPAAGGFEVILWTLDRAKRPRNCLLEYIAGLSGDRVCCAGRRDERGIAYESLVSVLKESGGTFAFARLPPSDWDPDSGGRAPPEIFGRPAVAGDVLLLPTARAIFRFDLGGGPRETRADEIVREIPGLDPYSPPGLAPEEEPDLFSPPFGTLVSVEGVLYAATMDRLLAYVPSE
ncbi:MAG: hypothetical protein ACREID_01110, partial [Planctomycetota bacterium]